MAKSTIPVSERPYEARFCSRLRTVRQLRGLSQEKLGKAAGVPQSFISKMEAGNAGVGLTYAISLCDALRVSLDEMIGEKELQIVTVR